MYCSTRARITLSIMFVLAAYVCNAADVQTTILDASGKPVVGAVFIASSANANGASRASPQPNHATAIMDQMNKEFVPEILVIRTGTAVLFPNSDSVAHQVYSFSPAKRFELPLYRGRPHSPQIFDKPGVVTLGCNIHDHMVGYIVVTDSPYFGQADVQGRATLKGLAPGAYRIGVWQPRFNEQITEQSVNVADADVQISFKLTKPMQPNRSSNKDRRIRDY
jgi:plastocyanin